MAAALAARVRFGPCSVLVLLLGACGSSVDTVEAEPDQLITPSSMDDGSTPRLESLAWVRQPGAASRSTATRFDPLVKPPRRDAGAGGSEVDSGSTAQDAGALAPTDAGSTAHDAGAGTDAADAGWAHSGPYGAEVSPHLGLGIPDESSVGRPDKWLLVRAQYVVSYDTTRKVPNWSAWKLDSSFFGPATRATSFRVDPLLGSAPQARDADYVGSGFDRGHLCPSADRTLTDADNDATFFLTNVVPQTHASNAGPWLTLEDEARDLANAGKKLLIIAGPLFAASPPTIGTGVAVPSATWKVVVVTDGEANPATLSLATTKVYATVIPNVSVVSGSWRQWQTTVDAIEQLTGLELLSDVPPAVADVLEARLDP